MGAHRPQGRNELSSRFRSSLIIIGGAAAVRKRRVRGWDIVRGAVRAKRAGGGASTSLPRLRFPHSQAPPLNASWVGQPPASRRLYAAWTSHAVLPYPCREESIFYARGFMNPRLPQALPWIVVLSRVDDGCGDVPLEKGRGESGHADVETSRTLIGEVKFDTSDDEGGVGRSVKERLGIC